MEDTTSKADKVVAEIKTLMETLGVSEVVACTAVITAQLAKLKRKKKKSDGEEPA